MNLDSIKNFFGNLGVHDLPAAGAVLVALVLLFFVFKTGKFINRLILLLLAVALFAEAW